MVAVLHEQLHVAILTSQCLALGDLVSFLSVVHFPIFVKGLLYRILHLLRSSQRQEFDACKEVTKKISRIWLIFQL